MKHCKIGKKPGGFEVLASSRSVQAARMTLPPGGTSDDEPSNEHRRCEQWLFVVTGSGEARIGKTADRLRRVKIAHRSLLLIEKGELHQIVNTGRTPLVALNFYAPPAYEKNGAPRPDARRSAK